MSTIQDMFRKVLSYNIRETNICPSMNQVKAAKDILECRTAKLGGHKYECENCGHSVIRYNSCRNRHCPSCQGVK